MFNESKMVAFNHDWQKNETHESKRRGEFFFSKRPKKDEKEFPKTLKRFPKYACSKKG
jgi:hypothetical protein